MQTGHHCTHNTRNLAHNASSGSDKTRNQNIPTTKVRMGTASGLSTEPHPHCQRETEMAKQTEENCILQAHADTLAMHASWQTLSEMPGTKQKQRYNDDDDVDQESRVLLLRLLFLLRLLLHLAQAYTAFCNIEHGCKMQPVHAPARDG